jgi:hypothetical protein
MKPYPFVGLNHLTVPVATACSIVAPVRPPGAATYHCEWAVVDWHLADISSVPAPKADWSPVLNWLMCKLTKSFPGDVAMKIDGGCHCGFIAYEAEADPEMTGICHCTDCQTLSGSAFRSVVPTRQGSFKLRSGEPKIYVKTAESGTERQQAFCPNCGTPIYSTTVDHGPKVHSIRVGTLRQRDEFAPKLQYWFRSAQHWTDDLGSIPKNEKQR